MGDERRGWRGWVKAPMLSPLGLLLRAGAIAAVFAVLHALGLREYAAILSGSSPTGGPADAVAAVLALAYILFWFAFVLGVPVLVLGAVLQLLLMKWRRPQAP